METYHLANDITVFMVTASPFPQGIREAHDTLRALAPASGERRYFGISRPEQGKGIVYKAAAEEIVKDELREQGLEEFIIQKGDYIYITIHHYTQNIPAIGAAFEQLIHQENIDPDGYCIEWYLNDTDVKCMVKLK